MSLLAVAGCTSEWARIEAGWQYPSDTLFSTALGNFLGPFVNDAFLGLTGQATGLSIGATDGGALLQWGARF